MPPVRRLTAILAADVAGYSRLMGVDEEGTHERLQAHLGELVNPKIAEHRGRIVKNTGDGFLAEFPSVVDAVRCAVEVQRGMVDRNKETPPEKRIEFRIGINLGDVIAEEDDIFGDGVNVAARVEALADPGGICVSRVVRDQVRDRVDYNFEELGEQQVKNIARPVRVYAWRPDGVDDRPTTSVPIAGPMRRRRKILAPIGAAVAAVLVLSFATWWFWPTTRSSSAPPAAVAAATSIAHPLVAPRLSIVVLPFANLSDDREQQYFADGVTEDLTTDLSRIAHMFVISRNSAFTYKDKPINAKQIGRELGVRYVLEGSVQRSGNQLRINAQLIDAETDAHLWAERFDRDLGDLFALQNEVTGRIGHSLNFELVTAEAARPIENPDMLDYFFRASAAFYKPPTRESYVEVVSLLEKALALDPGSGEAQNRLASVLAGRLLNNMTDTPAADLERAKALSEQALVSAPGSAGAHYAKGQVLRAQRRCAEAIPEYEAVLAYNRNSAYSYFNIANCKLFTGSIEETIPLVERAIRLSPRDPFALATWYQTIGLVHLLQSRTDEAILWSEKARSHSPALSNIRATLAAAYAINGEMERAAGELAEARRLSPDDRYSSIARLKAARYFGAPKVRALFEATYLVGLRKAGMPEE